MSENTAALPCWYELGTTDLSAADAFYTEALGWTIVDPRVPGFEYRLGSDGDGNGVAGMMGTVGQAGSPAPNWIFYTEVDDCDAITARAGELGGKILRPPADVPGTGRFAVLADPQGAAFGVLQPTPMDNPPTVRAFDQGRTGHGNWHDLSTSDPQAALDFYSELFGWSAGESMDMGEGGNYQMFVAGPTALGGINALLGSPSPNWLPYFGVNGVDAAVQRVTAAGGSLTHGPAEVPGGAVIAHLTDPQGAAFGIVGPQ